MGYKDSNNRPLSPQQNPYAAFGSASAVAGQDIRHPIAEIDSIANLIERVKYILDYQTEPIRFFFAGDYGAGKSARLNIIRQKVITRYDNSVCIPIKFQEVVDQINLSTSPNLNEIQKLYGIIIDHIMNSLIAQNALNKEECKDLLKNATVTQYLDLIIELFQATNKKNILLIFDEVEILFSSLDINVSQFMTFMHNLSEKLFSVSSSWGVCVSVTSEYLRDIKKEAGQLRDGRFDFIEVEALSPQEIRDYIEKKNCQVTQNYANKSYPFDEEVVEFISVVSGGLPRYIEVISHLLWSSKAEENSSDIVDINTAKRVFINKYKNRADAYFNDFCRKWELPENIKAFLYLLFLEGGYKLSIKALVKGENYKHIPYMYNLSHNQAHNLLYKSSKIIRDKIKNDPEFSKEERIKYYRSRAYLFSLTNLTYKEIYNYE